MEITVKRNSISETKIETQALTRLLLTAEVGQTIAYEQLNAACGMNTQDDARGYLATARKNAEAELHCVFDTVFNVGLKRLEPAEYHGVGTKVRNGLRRKARRTFRRLTRITNAEYESLPAESRNALDAERTMLAFVSRASGNAARKKIEGVVQDQRQAIPFAKTLELFKKK
jgi:hypothetical protein